MNKTIHLLTSLIGFALCGTSVRAAANYWDINGATAGAGGATPAGTWDTGTTANWSADPAGAMATTTWTDHDDAIFSAGSDATGAFTVNLSGTPVVGKLTVEEGAITIAGGTALNLGGALATNGIVDVFANSTLAISSVITGGDNTGSITKGISGGTGTGTLVLAGNNTYTGQTTVLVGTLSFDSIGDVNAGPSALGNPSSVALGTIDIGGGTVGATLKYTGPGHTTDRVLNQAGTSGGATIEASGSGPIVFTSPGGITATGGDKKKLSLVGTNKDNNTISGTIVNNTASKYTQLEKRDYGTWVLTGNNTFSGVCDIRQGTLVVNSLGDEGMASSVGTGNVGTWHAVIGLGGLVGGIGSTNAILKYIGTGHSTTRKFCLWGPDAAGGTIDASGTGPLVLWGDIIHNPDVADTVDKVFTLTGDNTGANTIGGAITDGVGGFKTSVKKNGPGKWVITGVSSYTGTTTVNQGTLLINSPGSLHPNSAVSVNSGATLGGSGTISGPVTLNSGGILSPGASVGTLTLGSDLILSGTWNLFVELDKSLSPSNDMVTVVGTLTNAGTGTVMVTNLGPALAVGDNFQLFNKPVLNGEALTVVSAGSVVWTNKLAVDGSITVLSTGVQPPVPATNLTIVTVGPTSFDLGGWGAANSAYHVYASTNVTTPMTNWWFLGTIDSGGDGAIQFLDSQATNEQRFYRFGQ